MAQLSPSLPTQRKDAGLARELDVLEHLQQDYVLRGLSDLQEEP